MTGIRMEERRLSIVEFVMHLGINRDTIWQWVKQKQSFAHKVGRLRKFMALEAKKITSSHESGGIRGREVIAWEREIDERVYRLYGLTKEEIKIVEEGAKR